VAAGRRSDGMALFARLCHFAGLIGFYEATVSTAVEDRLCPQMRTFSGRACCSAAGQNQKSSFSGFAVLQKLSCATHQEYSLPAGEDEG